MFLRALLLRCPNCGRAGVMRHWFAARDHCSACGMRFHRQEGFMLGSMTINTIVTFLALAVVLVVGLVVTSPDVPVAGLIVVGALTAVLVPVLIYPWTVTIWVATELAMRPLESDEYEPTTASR
jgi:uncharacterized protein (DUF983 family)